MKLLIVAATWNEIKPLEAYLLDKNEEKKFRPHAIELLVTGPGIAFTAFHLGKMLPLDNWDIVLNLGICGSFNKEIPIGTTVQVSSDTFADWGAEDEESYLDVFELQLIEKNAFPFNDGWLINNHAASTDTIKQLPQAKGITVNTVSGKEATIEKLRRKFRADVETMEGASFMYCCMKESIRHFQVRTVSNYIEKRDRTKWDVSLAIKNLNETAIRIVEELLQTPALQ